MTVESVPVARLRTSYASLRSKVSPRADGLATMPIRVVPSSLEPGCYEIVDGLWHEDTQIEPTGGTAASTSRDGSASGSQ